MPWPHPNLEKIPAEVERPIVSTMRNIYEWDFEWEYRNVDDVESVEATLPTDEGPIGVRWELVDDHWYVSKIVCPGWSDRRPVGPGTTKGVQRWLQSREIPKTRKW